MFAIGVVGYLCIHGWLATARLERQYRDLSSRTATVERAVVDANALKLAAQIYADDVVGRAWETAARQGVPMWVADGPRGEEADLANAPD